MAESATRRWSSAILYSRRAVNEFSVFVRMVDEVIVKRWSARAEGLPWRDGPLGTGGASCRAMRERSTSTAQSDRAILETLAPMTMELMLSLILPTEGAFEPKCHGRRPGS